MIATVPWLAQYPILRTYSLWRVAEKLYTATTQAIRKQLRNEIEAVLRATPDSCLPPSGEYGAPPDLFLTFQSSLTTQEKELLALHIRYISQQCPHCGAIARTRKFPMLAAQVFCEDELLSPLQQVGLAIRQKLRGRCAKRGTPNLDEIQVQTPPMVYLVASSAIEWHGSEIQMAADRQHDELFGSRYQLVAVVCFRRNHFFSLLHLDNQWCLADDLQSLSIPTYCDSLSSLQVPPETNIAGLMYIANIL